MLVTLTNTATGTFDLQAEVTWRLPSAREHGRAVVRVPRGHAAYSSSYMTNEGDFAVDIRHPLFGTWRGIAEDVAFDRQGHATINALELSALTQYRNVSSGRFFRAVTAGCIARFAVVDAMGGLGSMGILPGTFVEGAPIITEYRFEEQSLQNVLDDMAEASGQEWEIDSNYRLNWVTATGTLYETHLWAGGDLVDVERASSAFERLAEVSARDNNGRVYVARAPETAVIPRQLRINVDTHSLTTLAIAAESALATRRQVPIELSAALRRKGNRR